MNVIARIKKIKVGESLVLGMAYNRETYIDRIEAKLLGALLEYYKARLAKVNGETRLVDHWLFEVARLLNKELPLELLHSIKGKWDRKKATQEAIRLLKARDKSFKTAAVNVIKKDFKRKDLAHELTQKDTDDFYFQVQSIIDTYLT